MRKSKIESSYVIRRRRRAKNDSKRQKTEITIIITINHVSG